MDEGPIAAHTVVMKTNQHNWTRLDGVDVLRSLAILLVLLNHVNMRLFLAHVPYTHGLPRQFVSSLVWNGQRGVQIFFAVSGFLITSMSLRRWRSLAWVQIRDFYTLRLARIVPLLLLLLAVLSILDLQHVPDFQVRPATGGLGQALFAALTFHVNLLEAQRGYLPPNWDVLWSLSVEETFYLCFPLVCWALGRRGLIVPLLLVFAGLGPIARTALSHGNPVWREYSYLGSTDAISLGCLTALILARYRLSSRLIRICGITGIALLAAILCFSMSLDQWGLRRSGLDETVVAAGACLIIAAAAQSGWRAPSALRVALLPGRRSYEIYLTHMFVVLALFSTFTAMGGSIRMVPLLFVAAIAVATLFGEWVARLYSEPLNALLRSRLGRQGRASLPELDAEG